MLNSSRRWSSLFVASFVAGSLSLAACSGGDDDASPSPSPSPVTLTFKVDVSSKADGTNALAEVKSGEAVYVVGNFAGWNPNNETFKMTDEGNGIWSLTLTLPFTGKDYDGNDFIIEPGASLEYKFAKTNRNGEAWTEGQKDYILTSEKACPGAPEGASGGLWEVANYTLTVPDAATTLDTVVVEAWRETAEDYGLTSCN